MASLEHSCYRFGDEPIRCTKCSGNTVKNGKILGKQQYKCKECNKRFQLEYTYKACEPNTSPNIVALIKEGFGIRSIARIGDNSDRFFDTFKQFLKYFMLNKIIFMVLIFPPLVFGQKDSLKIKTKKQEITINTFELIAGGILPINYERFIEKKGVSS